MNAGDRRLWYSTAYDQRAEKWLTIEHVEQTVGVFDTREEAEADGAGRLP